MVKKTKHYFSLKIVSFLRKEKCAKSLFLLESLHMPLTTGIISFQ